jgi:hypothetical protein
MTGESFPLLAWLPSIARYGNGSAGPPPTRPARGNSLSRGPGRSSMIRARDSWNAYDEGRPVTRREMGSRVRVTHSRLARQRHSRDEWERLGR